MIILILFDQINILKMTIKKKKSKARLKAQKKNNSSLAKLASITTNSLGNAFSKYKKNLEKKKIREIKLKKLEDKN